MIETTHLIICREVINRFNQYFSSFSLILFFVDIKRSSSRDPEPSLSWVFQEVGSKTASGVFDKKLRKSSGDSGVEECEPNEPEKFFGPIDITDEIFEGMFSPTKNPQTVCEDPTNYENIFHFSEVDSDLERITEL